jgi:hypothetical protein
MAKAKPPRLTLRRGPGGDYAAEPDDGIERYSTGNSGLHWPARRGNKHGRPKGVGNSIGTVMKAVLIEGAAMSKRGRGSLLNYLASCADEFPLAYMRLLGRLIPHDLRLRLRTELDEPLETAEDVRRKLQARGIDISKLGPLFAKPEVPTVPNALAPVHRRYTAGERPSRDEDNLQVEPGPPPVAEVSEPEPPVTINVYSDTKPEPPRGNPWASDLRHRPVQPHKLGRLPVNGEPGSQLEIPFDGVITNPDLHAWSWGRPPRLVSNNTDEETDATPPQPRLHQRR